MTDKITATELNELMASRELYAVIDVRDFGEFYRAHIPWANSVSRGTLEFRIGTLLPHKDVKVVVYGRSAQLDEAASTLESLGYTNVTILKGSFDSWKEAGFETMHGTNTPGKDYGERVYVENAVPTMTVEEYPARRRQGELFYCLDPRTERDFNIHLPGAYSVPGGELPFEITDIARVKEANILVCCYGRTRGILGTFLLRKMGLTNVYYLNGGVGAWRIAGEKGEIGSGQPKPPASEASIAIGVKFTERLAKEEDIQFLSPRDVKARLDQNEAMYILDARLPAEYIRSHIETSVNLPAGQVSNAVENVVAVKNATMVTVSGNRARAIIAAYWLKEIGYPKVYALDGGTQTWSNKGSPIESGAPVAFVPGLERAREQANFITVEELKAKLDSRERPLLVDERGIGAFGTAHIPGARWVSRSYLSTNIAKEAPNKDSQLIVYCDDSQASTLSTPTLKGLGYNNIFVLQGGFEAWCQADYPVEVGLGDYSALEEIAIHEVGLMRGGPYGYTNERMQEYLDREEALGNKYRKF